MCACMHAKVLSHASAPAEPAVTVGPKDVRRVQGQHLVAQGG